MATKRGDQTGGLIESFLDGTSNQFVCVYLGLPISVYGRRIVLGSITRNVTPTALPDKQQKIYNALALASVPQNAAMDTSRSGWLNPASLRQFILTQQMELVDEADCIKLIHVSSDVHVSRSV